MRISDWSSDVCSSDLEEVVDREAVLAHQPADATAKGQPGDPGVAHDSAGGGQTVRLRLVVDVTPQRATLHPGPAVRGTDPPGPHRSEVRSEARRLGKACVATCTTRGPPFH